MLSQRPAHGLCQRGQGHARTAEGVFGLLCIECRPNVNRAVQELQYDTGRELLARHQPGAELDERLPAAHSPGFGKFN